MNYKESTKLTYNKVAERINAQDSGNWNEKVKKVSVVLTASRTGSSLMKTVLSMSNDVAYLSGEEEPYYIITENANALIKSQATGSKDFYYNSL